MSRTARHRGGPVTHDRSGDRGSGLPATRQVGVDAELALYADITTGLFTVEELTIADWHRVHELVERYRDLPLGGTDASVMALAERHGAAEIATLDHRHFHVVRPHHLDGFTLLP